MGRAECGIETRSSGGEDDMRYLYRNSRNFAYANPQKSDPILDGNGNETGEYSNDYSEPVSVRTSIGAPSGEEVLEMFGNFSDYTRVIILYSRDFPISEGTCLWLDGADVSGPHNAVVTSIRKHINCVYIAVKDV